MLAIADKEPQAEQWSPAEVIATALADVQSRKAAWTTADLTRAINDALPDYLGVDDGARIAELLDQLTAEALELAVPLDAERPAERVLPDELRLEDGRSAYEAPGARLYATPEHIHTERLLAQVADGRDAPALDHAAARRVIEELREAGVELGPDQAAAMQRGAELRRGCRVAGRAGGHGQVVRRRRARPGLAGPRLVGGAAAPSRRVGVEPDRYRRPGRGGAGTRATSPAGWPPSNASRTASRSVTTGTGDSTPAIWSWSTSPRWPTPPTSPRSTATPPPPARNCSSPAITASSPPSAPPAACNSPPQTAPSYELSEARRFAHEWERAASLRLRDGDESVLGDYHKHGRLLDAGALEQADASAARAWLADTLAGKRSLLIVDTNERAAKLSAQIRTDLIRLGHVAEDGVPLGLQDTTAGVGDIVQARKNQWDLAGVSGNRRGPINRERYRVLDTLDDGGLIVTPIDRDGGADHAARQLRGRARRARLRHHRALRTGPDRGHQPHGDHQPHRPRGALRGAESRPRANTAHVVTRAVPDDSPTGTVNRVMHRDPITVIAAAFELAQPEQSALATAADSRRPKPSRSAPRASCSPTAANKRLPGAPPAGSTNSSTPATSPRPSAPRSPPKTAPPTSTACCDRPNSPATTPDKSSTTPSPAATWPGRGN